MEPKAEPSNDDPNNVTNILGLIISILDWLKTTGKSGQPDLICPEKCEIDNAIDKLREMTTKLGTVDSHKSCNCKEGEDENDSEKIPCFGGEDGGRCKDPTCETCEKIRKRKEEEGSKDSYPARIVKELVEKCSKPSIPDTKNSVKLIENEEPPKEILENNDDECPVLKMLFMSCNKCCQTSKEALTEKPKIDQDDDKLKKTKTSCNCNNEAKDKAAVVTYNRVNQSKVITYEKKVQAHQFQIMYEQRKAVLKSMYEAALSDSNRNFRNGPVVRPGQGTYRAVEIAYASEDDDMEDEDDVENPYKDLCRQMRQDPNDVYGCLPSQYFKPCPYQSSRIPQRTALSDRGGMPYQSYRHYQELRYPKVSEGVKSSASPPRGRVALCGPPIKISLKENSSRESSRDATPASVGSRSPSKTGYTPPADCARRLIEAIMKNPTCPAFEVLKEAAKLDDEIEEESSTEGESRNQSRRSSSGMCYEDCNGTLKKKRSQSGK
nr:uncharacterized protein LOC111418802 isoform X1 [Onthophagus taurus]